MSDMKEYLEIRKLEAEADALKAKAKDKKAQAGLIKAQAGLIKAETDQLLVRRVFNASPSVLMTENQSIEPPDIRYSIQCSDTGHSIEPPDIRYSIQCSDTGAGTLMKQAHVAADSGLCSTI